MKYNFNFKELWVGLAAIIIVIIPYFIVTIIHYELDLAEILFAVCIGIGAPVLVFTEIYWNSIIDKIEESTITYGKKKSIKGMIVEYIVYSSVYVIFWLGTFTGVETELYGMVLFMIAISIYTSSIIITDDTIYSKFHITKFSDIDNIKKLKVNEVILVLTNGKKVYLRKKLIGNEHIFTTFNKK